MHCPKRTKLAEVGPLRALARSLRSIWGPGWHEALSTAEVAVTSGSISIAALVWSNISVPAVLGGWGDGVATFLGGAGLQAHVVHVGLCALHLDITQLGLEVLNVPAPIAYLAVETRQHGGVVGRLAHGVGSVDEGLLLVNLLLDLADGVIGGSHGGGGGPGRACAVCGGSLDVAACAERRRCPSGRWVGEPSRERNERIE